MKQACNNDDNNYPRRMRGRRGGVWRRALLRLAVLLPLLPAAAWSADGAGQDDCAQAATTSAIVECHDAQTRHWDQRLNHAYQALQKNAEPAQREPLKTAQRLWIRYRDANCRYHGAAGGTIARVLAADCLRSMTKQRACELEAANDPQQGQPGPQCPAAQ